MSLKYGSFDTLEEQINNILNTNAILTILNQKGLITANEFIAAKEKALSEFKQQYPELFASNNEKSL